MCEIHHHKDLLIILVCYYASNFTHYEMQIETQKITFIIDFQLDVFWFW